MNIKQEIQQLKDNEQAGMNPETLKKDRPRVTFSFELWPFIPVLIVVGIANYLLSNSDASSVWNYWWLIFLVKPFLFGWGKSSKNRPPGCLKRAA